MRRPLTAVVLACLFSPAAQARVAPPPAAPKRGPARLAHRVVGFAKRQLGVPYRWGGISRRTGFDCSGLVYAAYRSIGRKLPHSTWGQMTLGARVRFARLRPGDLVFTNGGGHVVLVVSRRASLPGPDPGAAGWHTSQTSLPAPLGG